MMMMAGKMVKSSSAEGRSCEDGEGVGGGRPSPGPRPRRRPGWLEGVVGPDRGFFQGCGDHSDRRKNEKNIFCLRCCLSLCPHCLPAHPSHPLLQVRRYVYHDVIRLGDLEKLIDCSHIQPYTINGAKVIFLNERPPSQSSRSFGSGSGSGKVAASSPNICFNCDRILQDPFHFCSLQCKVDHLAHQGEDLSDILRRFDEKDFPISQFEGLRMDGLKLGDDEVAEVEPRQHVMTYTGNYGSTNFLQEDGSNPGDGRSHMDHDYLADTSSRSGMARMGKKNRKKKGLGNGLFAPAAGGINVTSSSSVYSQQVQSSRRKGAPHRAPFS